MHTKTNPVPAAYQFSGREITPIDWPLERVDAENFEDEMFKNGFSNIFSRVDDEELFFNLEIYERFRGDAPYQFYVSIDAGNVIYNFFLSTIVDLNDFLGRFEPILSLKCEQ